MVTPDDASVSETALIVTYPTHADVAAFTYA
jgi:hypothetical protein